MEWLNKLLKILGEIIEEIFSKKIDYPDTPVNASEPERIDNMYTPSVQLPEVPKYEWDTPAKARHSSRVIMDEMGLTGVIDSKTGLSAKNLLCAVIDCESGFKPNAKNLNNKDGTGDYGIIQANSYWYIGKGKPLASIEEALNNPEKCIRIIIQKYKQGLLKNWVCYSAGYYKKHLK